MAKYWGPHFPDHLGNRFYWDGHFPDKPRTVASSPLGAGIFVLVLESGTKVKYTFTGSVTKSKNGKERRTSTNDLPQQSFAGNALLVGDKVLVNRSRIARYAALGQPFLLGLAYEEITITVDSPSYDISVSAAAMLLCDWANPLQRVIVEDVDGNVDHAVITTVTASTITIDKELASLSRKGSRVMPGMSILLDPTQTFTRFATEESTEKWSIAGQAVKVNFAGTDARYAILPLEPPQTNSGNLDGLVYQAVDAGIAGNDIRVKHESSAIFPSGEVEESGDDVTVKFVGNETTVQQLYDLVNSASSKVRLIGSFDPTALVAMSDDEFGLTSLDGGYDSIGYVGRGATVTNYWFKPIWNRRLIADDGVVVDQVQTLADIINMEGIPFAAPASTRSEWGRQVFYRRSSVSEWQWIKLFMHTVKGFQKTWWLPTWRQDLHYSSMTAPGELIIEGPGEESGDFNAWYPKYSEHIQLYHLNDSVTYARISDAVDNGNGTMTLTILDEADTPIAIPASAIRMISWLELCRFERKFYEVEWQGTQFVFDELARVTER